MAYPARGDVWYADLDPVRGHEQAGRRPARVVSVDLGNQGPAGLVVLLPMTSQAKGIPFHVAIEPPEGGVRSPSFVECEDIRSVARKRLSQRLGAVTPETLRAVSDRLRILLDL